MQAKPGIPNKTICLSVLFWLLATIWISNEQWQAVGTVVFLALPEHPKFLLQTPSPQRLPSLPLAPQTTSCPNWTKSLTAKVLLLRFASFKSLVWSESSQIPLVESSSGFCHNWQRGKWLRQWSMQCLKGPACRGFWDYWVWCSWCPGWGWGHKRELEVATCTQLNSLLALLD